MLRNSFSPKRYLIAPARIVRSIGSHRDGSCKRSSTSTRTRSNRTTFPLRASNTNHRLTNAAAKAPTDAARMAHKARRISNPMLGVDEELAEGAETPEDRVKYGLIISVYKYLPPRQKPQ